MTAKTRGSKRSLLRLLIFVGIVATGLAVASAVFAGWTTISLTNSIIDGIWGAADYTDANNDPLINDRDEILNAWVRYDGTFIYFRVETIGSKILSGANGRLVGALDCNHDGDFNDGDVGGPTGDRRVVFAPDNTVTLYTGTNSLVGGIAGDRSDPDYASAGSSIEWGIPLYYLPPTCRASTSPINVAWATGTGAGVVLDQSQSHVELSNPMDYGDTGQTLPNPPATCGSPYTGLQCDGARHGIVPISGVEPLRFGSAAVDADQGNLQSAGSDADDTSGTTPDDEGGIYPDPTNPWNDGSGALNFLIVGAASARVGCWVDFNKNGVWTDAGETIINNPTIGSGTTARIVTIPGGLTWPNSFPARCRIYPTTVTTASPYGPIEFGEVEDHIWEFNSSGVYVGPDAPAAPSAVTGLVAATSGASDVNLTWTNPAPNNAARVLGHASNPYFTAATGSFLVDTTDSAAPWEYVHSGIRGAPASTVYYIVYGRVGATEATTPSNRVGLFEFGLTAGTP